MPGESSVLVDGAPGDRDLSYIAGAAGVLAVVSDRSRPSTAAVRVPVFAVVILVIGHELGAEGKRSEVRVVVGETCKIPVAIVATIWSGLRIWPNVNHRAFAEVCFGDSDIEICCVPGHV